MALPDLAALAGLGGFGGLGKVPRLTKATDVSNPSPDVGDTLIFRLPAQAAHSNSIIVLNGMPPAPPAVKRRVPFLPSLT